MPNFTIPNKDALLCKHKRGGHEGQKCKEKGKRQQPIARNKLFPISNTL